MLQWILNNIATIIICAIILLLGILAARYLYKSHKAGKCAGCPGCSSCDGSCCNCSHSSQPVPAENEQKKH